MSKRNTFGVVLGLLLIAAGAVLAFAVDREWRDVDASVLGWALVALGVLVLLWALFSRLRGGGATASHVDTPREALVRHEEELRIDAVPRDIGAVHARKRVDEHTEKQRVDRNVERLGKVERVTAEAGDSGQIETLPDGSISIPLLEERIVVTKQTVVRERVILRKQVKTEHEQVKATLRKERVEVDADRGVEISADARDGQS